MPPLVDIRHLEFAYRDQPVLKDVTLPVQQGETLGVIGPNGGGKTTLLRILLGQAVPTRGAALIAGLTPRQAIERGDLVGYLPQNPAFPERLPINVRQLVRTGLAGKVGMLRRPGADDLRFVEHLLERVGIPDLANRPVGALSGGQRQRVLIARALASRPKVLLLDEPTTGIDPSGQAMFVGFLQQIRREMDLTVLLVSHDLAVVQAVANRVACLNVTLHFHDESHLLGQEVVERAFGCNLSAIARLYARVEPPGPLVQIGGIRPSGE